MELNFDHAVSYHDGAFPPSTVDYPRIIQELLQANDALARYDQALVHLHNRELFLAPLRNQEAVLSSRMEHWYLHITRSQKKAGGLPSALAAITGSARG